VTRQLLERLRRAEQIISIFERLIDDLTPAHYLEQLRRVHRYLTELHMAMPGALVIFGPNGVIQQVNAATLELLGRDALTGRPVSEIFGADPDAIGVGGRSEVRRAEMSWRSASGELVPVLASFARMRPDGGETDEGVVTVCVGMDLRDQKRLESELAQKQKLEAVGRLAAGIAHEINSPIQFVGDNVRFIRDSFGDVMGLLEGYRRLAAEVRAGRPTDALLRELERAEATADLEVLRPRLEEAFVDTTDGVERVARIVSAMKEFAHPSSRSSAPIDLNHALETTLTIANFELKYVADVETHFGELPSVLCHADAINQAFLNLIINAAHAVSSVVRDTGARGRIRVATQQEGAQALVTISDTGCGIPESIRHRVFEPFFTTKEVGKGTGQGLAIARSIIVDQHGGSLSFESELGRGTTFFVRVPVGGSEAEEMEALF
jgi:signal transduction histidine kinase